MEYLISAIAVITAASVTCYSLHRLEIWPLRADRDLWRRRAEWLARFWADEIMWDGRNDGKSWAEIVTEKSKAADEAVKEAK